MPTRRVLIAMDGSSHAERALLWYTQHLMRPEDEILFLYALETAGTSSLSVVSGQSLLQSSAGAGSSLAGPGKRLSMAIRDKCQELGIDNECVFLEKMTQGPGQSIVEAATSEGADVIVMGNRGMGKLKRTVLGSVSEYVLHNAHRPVVIVPPERSQRKTSMISTASK